jgi:uncharacterized sporulation protein YeaH/YhbH (DUF444 family)
MSIDADLNRFHNIIRGRIKGDLGKFISRGELVARSGNKNISIPIAQIDIPRFKFGKNESGVGQGEGQVGDQAQPGEGSGESGDQPGEHSLEVDITLEELAVIMGEELGLPKMKQKGLSQVATSSVKYTGILRRGPESLNHFKRTYKEALKRSISTGEYDPDNPVVVPVKDDRRYKSYRKIQKPVTKAVIVYIMDVSGSMGDEQKDLVRLTSFWLDTWISSQYQGIDKCYIVHDATAKEVSQEVFYKTKESGGTLISSAYRLLNSLLAERYSPSEWNIYVYHFSDGDNWSGNDTSDCISILENQVFPAVNSFCYGQVESRYGSGQFYRDLIRQFGESHEQLSVSQIKDKDHIVETLKTFLRKGS